MNIEIHGVVGWICGICVGTTAVVTVLLGVWELWNWLWWEVICGSALRWLRLHRTFCYFIYYRVRILEWVRQTKAKEAYEEKPEGATDIFRYLNDIKANGEGLDAEIIAFAFLALKRDPTLTIEQAIDEAFAEWVK